MSTKIAVYVGVGTSNSERVTAFADSYSIEEPIGTISGPEGSEIVKVCDSLIELPCVMPDIKSISERLVKGRLIQKIEELNELQKAFRKTKPLLLKTA